MPCYCSQVETCLRSDFDELVSEIHVTGDIQCSGRRHGQAVDGHAPGGHEANGGDFVCLYRKQSPSRCSFLLPTLSFQRLSLPRTILRLNYPVCIGDFSTALCRSSLTIFSQTRTPVTPHYIYLHARCHILNFPAIWQPALSHLPSDAERLTQIAPNVSVIAPNGGLNGSTVIETYDTVDDPSYFYDYLASQNQKVTVFYIGSNAPDWQLEAQCAVAGVLCRLRCMSLVSVTSNIPILTYPFYSIRIGPHLLLCTIAVPYDYHLEVWLARLARWAGNITAANVDTNDGLFINNETSEVFDPAGGGHSQCSYELNNSTNGMQNSGRCLWYAVLLSPMTSVRKLNLVFTRL